jgi:hypothetical protein
MSAEPMTLSFEIIRLPRAFSVIVTFDMPVMMNGYTSPVKRDMIIKMNRERSRSFIICLLSKM